MPTPHIEAGPDAFAELVLLPGDPLRAQEIAEGFFTDPVRVTAVRNMYGFTGTFAGKPVSVMGSGMGIPSMLIYATELVREYGVQRIVRVGTCGSVSPRLRLGDLFLASGAGTDSSVNRIRFKGYDLGATPSFDLLNRVYQKAVEHELPVQVGPVFSTDLFYAADPEQVSLLEQFGFLGIEMEAAGLYGLAMQEGFEALAVMVATDSLLTHESVSPEMRQSGPRNAIQVALEALLG
ncbi:MAG: purine-nucleoside phosphorylase [Xanthomonadales bacterium]|nr:purine-nucleoside phosphorylase [Xanthomonadales bacterium]